MATTLRRMIDGLTLFFAVPATKPPATQPEDDDEQQDGTNEDGSIDPQAMARNISEHISDPLEKTKKGFEDLTNAKLNYEMQKENMRRQIIPVQSVLNDVSQLHGLNPQPYGTSPVDPNVNNDPNMGYQEDKQGVPPNMAQTPGMMQQSRPGQQVSYPGAGPKIPTPPFGVPGAPQQQKPTAAKPPGAGAMAKKPGTPTAKKKPAAKPAAGSQVSVHVHAVGNAYAIQSGAKTIRQLFGAEKLRQDSTVKDK